jgi:hypothetical protein
MQIISVRRRTETDRSIPLDQNKVDVKYILVHTIVQPVIIGENILDTKSELISHIISILVFSIYPYFRGRRKFIVI